VIIHIRGKSLAFKGIETVPPNTFRKNTFDSSFDTINILSIVSVKELLFLQQQNIPRAEWGIIE